MAGVVLQQDVAGQPVEGPPHQAEEHRLGSGRAQPLGARGDRGGLQGRGRHVGHSSRDGAST